MAPRPIVIRAVAPGRDCSLTGRGDLYAPVVLPGVRVLLSYECDGTELGFGNRSVRQPVLVLGDLPDLPEAK